MTISKNIQVKRASLFALAVTMLVAVLLLCTSAWANTTGHDDGMRVNDFTGTLSSSDESELSKYAKSKVDELEFDFVIYITDKDDSATGLAEGFFTKNDYGYTSNDDGICLCIKPGSGEVGVYVSGIGSDIFTSGDVAFLENAAKKRMGSDCYGAVKDFITTCHNAVAKYRKSGETASLEASQPEPDASTEPEAQPAAPKHTTAELGWYPKDPSSFQDFHNENAPHVVDLADILTDEQEAQLNDKISDMVKRLGIDFVLMTDVTDYGLGHDVYAADYYQFNGYGLGDDYSGIIYFVCMEEGNRGFWTAARGGARNLLTEENVNALDDRTYDMFVDGNYGEAILTQFNNLDVLYTEGELPYDWSNVLAIIAMFVILAIILGAVFGFKNLATQRRRMKTIAQAHSAISYRASGPNFTVSTETNLGTTVSRTKRHTDDGGSSGGGRSSRSTYHSSYKSSGGASFSGGGRKF